MPNPRPNRAGPLNVLLLGYNGANNTGSEARLLAIIEDVRRVFGPQVIVTVPTLNAVNLRRYLKVDERTRIAPVPTIFWFKLRSLVKHSDLALLVEGSCYMDTWAAALLWAFLAGSKYAHEYGTPIMAYAVDSGQLKERRIETVRREASKVDLLVTRTQLSADRLRGWGVTAPMEVTDDTAFVFNAGNDQDILHRLWPEAKEVAGMAVVDFNIWPVVIRPFGRKRNCYRWPYYFSRTPGRRRGGELLAKRLAAEADRLIEKHHKHVALIAMEAVDEELALAVRSKMKHADMARVFSSNEYDAARMTQILRSLDFLITSRYHAAVLSMAGGVPQAALGHDLRLHDLYQESGMKEEFFIHWQDKDAWTRLSQITDRLVSEHDTLRERILAINATHAEKAKRNIELLRAFAKEKGLPVVE